MKRLSVFPYLIAVLFPLHQHQAFARDLYTGRSSNNVELLFKSRVANLKNTGSRNGWVGALQAAGYLKLPVATKFAPDNGNLPAPPDEDLREEISRLSAGDTFEQHKLFVIWMSPANFGAVYDIEGSGDCVNWIMFSVSHRAANLQNAPIIFRGDCSGDGTDAYLGLLFNQVVAMTIQNYVVGTGVIVQIQSWNGSSWDKPANFVLK